MINIANTPSIDINAMKMRFSMKDESPVGVVGVVEGVVDDIEDVVDTIDVEDVVEIDEVVGNVYGLVVSRMTSTATTSITILPEVSNT